MELAPILISVYTRLEHFKRCVQSLQKNAIAKDSILYIVSDGAANSTHVELVNSVRLYLKEITGFKKIELLEWKENLGSQKSIPRAIDCVFQKHDKLIYLEEDCYCAPNFLSFINKGLITYEKRNDIFSISGYNSPVKMPSFYKDDVYLRIGFVAWGVGIWKNKWYEVDWTMNKFNAFVDDKVKISKFKEIAPRSTGQILNMRRNGALLVDGVVAVHLVDNGMYSIYPSISRVRNHGHDGSGEHCGTNNKYIDQVIYEGEEDASFPPDIKSNAKLLKYVRRYYRLTWKQRIKQQIPAELKARVKSFIKK